MRTAKFRGLTLDTKKWVYGYYWCNEEAGDFHKGRHFIRSMNFQPAEFDYTDYEVDPETVGQFTGLKDKNLWQNDICMAEYRCPICCDNEPHLLTGTIEQANNGLWMFDYGHGAIPLDDEDLEIREVVGNIHTTPELLEGEK